MGRVEEQASNPGEEGKQRLSFEQVGERRVVWSMHCDSMADSENGLWWGKKVFNRRDINGSRLRTWL